MRQGVEAIIFVVTASVLLLIVTVAFTAHQKPPINAAALPGNNNRTQIPNATQPLEQWATVTISAKGRSPVIPGVPGMFAETTAESFVMHIVYADGTDCVSNCRDGAITGFYLENTVDRPITVSYAFGTPEDVNKNCSLSNAPCTLPLFGNKRTPRIEIPEGGQVCFSDQVWTRPEYGFTVSDRDGRERPFPQHCARFNCDCNNYRWCYPKSFRFTLSNANLPLPTYWFLNQISECTPR